MTERVKRRVDSTKWKVAIAVGIVLLWAAIIGAIVSGGNSDKKATNARVVTTAATPTTTAVTTTATTTTPAKATTATTERPTSRPKEDSLTGFGATVGAWNEHHDEDTRFAPGSAYDPDSALGDHVRFNDRYYAVSPQGGRVTFYSMRFPSETGIDEAKRFILSSEFPPDAAIAWFQRKDTCAQMLIRSSRLSRAIHSSALIEFSSGEAGDHYTPSAVSEAILLPATGSGKGFGC
jgi:hypothetical protein